MYIELQNGNGSVFICGDLGQRNVLDKRLLGVAVVLGVPTRV